MRYKFNYKKVIFSSFFLIFIMLFCLFGWSYAWYSFSDARTPFEVITSSGESGESGLVFSGDDSISTVLGAPVPTSWSGDGYLGIVDYVNPFKFSVTTSETQSVIYDLKLVDINMDSSLKSSNFRYLLFQNGVASASGNFSAIATTNGTLTLQTSQSREANTTYSYELYIWIVDSDNMCSSYSTYAACTSQNGLMEKSFSGKIQVSAISR